MGTDFRYDVFLSHSSKDKDVVREIANRLKADGVRVWFDEWEIQPGDNIPHKLEEGLEYSRMLVLCMSAQAFGSDWAHLESQTFRFKDPLNQNRRFIPARIDKTPIKGSLAQFQYIDWQSQEQHKAYEQLLAVCKPRSVSNLSLIHQSEPKSTILTKVLSLDHTDKINCMAISPDGKRVLSGAKDTIVRLWDLDKGKCLWELKGHTDKINCMAISQDGKRALSGSKDKTIRLWNLDNGQCLQTLKGHTFSVLSVAISPDGKRAFSGSQDKTVRMWNLDKGKCLDTFKKHTFSVLSVAISPDSKWFLSGAEGKIIRSWAIDLITKLALPGKSDPAINVPVIKLHFWKKVLAHLESQLSGPTFETWIKPTQIKSLSHQRLVLATDNPFAKNWLNKHYRHKISEAAAEIIGHKIDVVITQREQNQEPFLTEDVVFEGHTDNVLSMAVSLDGKLALSGSEDKTVRLWDLDNGQCLRELEGHTDSVLSVAISPDGKLALSGSEDKTARLWDLENGKCLKTLKGHTDSVLSVAISQNSRQLYSGDKNSVLHVWSLPTLNTSPLISDQVEYTNAKVLLVGNSAAGKTGLSNRLAMNTYTNTDSTVGAWATHWKLPIKSDNGVEKEVWLWDFGGQADQRLIHQLYMDQTQVVALVFDPQKPDLLEGLRTWDRDLARAATGNFRKLLVAGRIDAGRLRSVSRHQIEEFVSEYGFEQYIETSAKDNTGCEELKEAICQAIDWDSIAKRTTPKLSRSRKEIRKG